MPQSLKIYLTWLRSLGHRLTANLGKEVVTAFCCTIFAGLFVYMFTDFINYQLENLSGMVQEWASNIFTGVLIFSAMLLSSKIIRLENKTARNSFCSWLFINGEKPQTIFCFRVLRAATVGMFFHYIAFYAITTYLSQPPNNIAELSVCCCLITAVSSLLLSPPAESKPIFKNTLPTGALQWRLHLMLFRNLNTKIILLLSLLTLTMLMLKPIATSSLLSWVLCFLSGLFISFALYLYLGEELISSWLEKNSGLSHVNYMSLTIKLSLIIGALTSSTLLIFYFVGTGFSNISLNPSLVTKLVFSHLSPICVVPNIILQIDGRRPAINMMVGFLMSLFLATAIFSHLLSIILIPILFYYGLGSQSDRYYRA